MKKITSKFPGRNVLVVEDNLINQEIIKELLELMDFHIDIASHGKEALKSTAAKKYDIIFMDIQMPEMDGYETTRQIRHIESPNKHTTIIALTANAMSDDKIKCIEVGMNDYLSKPLDVQKLEVILQKYLINLSDDANK
ncbi:MAG: response regulator [Parachlamydiales bacterium]|jgi:CheY-like chemotaxis protein